MIEQIEDRTWKVVCYGCGEVIHTGQRVVPASGELHQPVRRAGITGSWTTVRGATIVRVVPRRRIPTLILPASISSKNQKTTT